MTAKQANHRAVQTPMRVSELVFENPGGPRARLNHIAKKSGRWLRAHRGSVLGALSVGAVAAFAATRYLRRA